METEQSSLKPTPEWKAKHKNAPKRIMITGACGAIGIHLLAYVLRQTDWEVIAVDSFKPEHKGYYDRLGMLLDHVDEVRTRMTLIVHDLNSPFTERQIEKIGEIDYIVNLASRSDVQASIDDPIPFVRNNTELMLNILEFARKVDPIAFLHFSTDEVYGPAPKDSGGHKEWEAILPSNPYSASKAAQEALAIAWWRAYNVPVIITNTMNNFGQMQAPSKFPAMIQKKIEADETIDIHATEEGEIGSRYYIHSQNSADAIVFILKNVQPKLHGPGEIDRPVRLNIVGDQQVSNLELVETIAKLMGKEAKTRMVSFHSANPGHDLHYGLNGEELAKLGWKSPSSFEDSMQTTIEWQKAHAEWMK